MTADDEKSDAVFLRKKADLREDLLFYYAGITEWDGFITWGRIDFFHFSYIETIQLNMDSGMMPE